VNKEELSKEEERAEQRSCRSDIRVDEQQRRRYRTELISKVNQQVFFF
jgi:hypothetical protein